MLTRRARRQDAIVRKVTRLLVAYGGATDAYMDPGTTHVLSTAAWSGHRWLP